MPDVCVHLRPTCPVRRPGLVDQVTRTLIDAPELDSVRTVKEVLHPPFKMWYRGSDGILAPVLRLDGLTEPWNAPRQSLPTTYIQTANVDAVRTSVIVQRGSMTGDRIFGFVEDDFCDIDTQEELNRAAVALAVSQPPIRRERVPGSSNDHLGPRTFCFDIDGVIAMLVPGNDYAQAEPRRNTIAIVNRLFELGHRIVLFTARGSETGIDWRAITEKQLKSWAVHYHELRFGKPAADYYIDDRMLSLDRLDQLFPSESVGSQEASR